MTSTVRVLMYCSIGVVHVEAQCMHGHARDLTIWKQFYNAMSKTSKVPKKVVGPRSGVNAP